MGATLVAPRRPDRPTLSAVDLYTALQGEAVTQEPDARPDLAVADSKQLYSARRRDYGLLELAALADRKRPRLSIGWCELHRTALRRSGIDAPRCGSLARRLTTRGCQRCETGVEEIQSRGASSAQELAHAASMRTRCNARETRFPRRVQRDSSSAGTPKAPPSPTRRSPSPGETTRNNPFRATPRSSASATNTAAATATAALLQHHFPDQWVDTLHRIPRREPLPRSAPTEFAFCAARRVAAAGRLGVGRWPSICGSLSMKAFNDFWTVQRPRPPSHRRLPGRREAIQGGDWQSAA